MTINMIIDSVKFYVIDMSDYLADYLIAINSIVKFEVENVIIQNQWFHFTNISPYMHIMR